MPIYDVKCSDCGYEGTTQLAILELNKWDSEAICPSCNVPSGFHRVIKAAPTRVGTARPSNAMKPGERDDMRHREFKRRNPDQVAEAVESVRRGTNEGF